jgi:hypothetical protein
VDFTRDAGGLVDVIQPNPAASPTGPLDVHALLRPPTTPTSFGVSNVTWEILRWEVVLLDGGLAAPVHQYVFELIRGTLAEIQAGTYTVLDTLNGTPPTNNRTLVLSREASPFPATNIGTVTGAQWLAVRVNDGDGGGRQMRVAVGLVHRP